MNPHPFYRQRGFAKRGAFILIKECVRLRQRAVPDRPHPAAHWDKPLITAGFIALVYYLSWWLQPGRIANPLLLGALVLAALYCTVQLAGNWVLYLAARRRQQLFDMTAQWRVDVFVTAYNEDVALIRRAVVAARDMRGSHLTWLLDDGRRPELRALAQQLGVGYLTRNGNADAKAGNINAALAATDGDIIVIFDIDHVPEPGFLEASLGYFADPAIGFVQVMLTFNNAADGWVARAASASTFDFYNPTSIGADRLGSATLIGSNALIRRAALATIGGYKPGLAEDLATSVALHSAGWRSVYVHQPLAPGLAPPSIVAWFTQQMKWSRGVFELLLADLPRRWRRLQLGQKAAYAVRMTYYWVGAFAGLHLALTAGVLLTGDAAQMAGFESYVRRLLLLTVMSMLIRQVALLRWQHAAPSLQQRIMPLILVYATWPVYSLALLMALLRVPLRFRPTPKDVGGRLRATWLLPQIGAALLLPIAVVYAAFRLPLTPYPAAVLFALAQAGALIIFLASVWWPAGFRPNPAPQ